ncbi:MAG: hypothetical protein HW398_141 [Acidobacteria bacterium]|nr:hypothetical protein [Acidobacteriota bacterium]
MGKKEVGSEKSAARGRKSEERQVDYSENSERTASTEESESTEKTESAERTAKTEFSGAAPAPQWTVFRLPHDHDFAEIVAGEIKLQGGEIAEQVLDGSVIEVAAQLAGFSPGYFQRIGGVDAVLAHGSIMAGRAGMEKSEQIATRLQECIEVFHAGLEQVLP